MDRERPRGGHRADAPHDAPSGGGRRVTFAVHDEGEGLLALYLTPCPAEVLADALEDLQTFAVHGPAGLRFPPALLAALHPPLQVTSHPCDHDALAAPHAAVPDEPGAFAASVTDPRHGVVHARGDAVLAAVLRRWLTAHLRASGVAFGLDGVADDAIRPLLAPLPPSCWSEPRVRLGDRLCTLDFETLGAPDHDPLERRARIRWVGAERSGWRTSWSW